MQFRPELAQKILTGEKTQTRRIVKPGEWLVELDGGGKIVFREPTTPKWITGQSYAIQPGTKATIGRFKLLDIRREQVQDITLEDAVAEGIRGRNLHDVFAANGQFLRRQYEWRWDYECETWKRGVNFSEQDSFMTLWDSINSGPGQRWDDNPEVWVLVFEVVEGKGD